MYCKWHKMLKTITNGSDKKTHVDPYQVLFFKYLLNLHESNIYVPKFLALTKLKNISCIL